MGCDLIKMEPMIPTNNRLLFEN